MSNAFNEFFWRLLREMCDNAQSLHVIKVAMHLACKQALHLGDIVKMLQCLFTREKNSW